MVHLTVNYSGYFRLVVLAGALAVAGCATTTTPATSLDPSVGKRQVVAASNVVATDQISALAEAVLALGPGIDPEEAARLARITYEHTDVLAALYQITDPPLVHNMKVNMGVKPRGLCKDWADDIEARLRQENFQTLSLHRAIANASNIRIEHSTVIVTAVGDGMFDGIVLDPWRFGGVLHWGAVTADPKYKWVPRQEVFALKRRRAEAEARRKGGNL